MTEIATETLNASISGPDGTISQGPDTIVNPNSPGEIERFTFSAGDNAIAIPAGTMLITIRPPSNNTVAWYVSGAASATNPLMLSPTGEQIIMPAAGSTGFNLHATGAISSPFEIIFE